MRSRLFGQLTRSGVVLSLEAGILLSLLSFMLASTSDARPAVARASVVLNDAQARRPSSTEEIGVLEDRRITHTWSEAESSAWLKGLRPGVDVVWTEAHTRRVELTVSVAGLDDTLNVGVLGTDGVVRAWTPLVANLHVQCQYKWDMKDDSGKRVEPGLYSIYLRLVRRNVGKILYVVVR
jgi:hypothetical protein